ncbi:hypothetical protein Shell_0592 [Staphylothermus hellenicus DSM 12710]|uniref:Uncharacterized protein n=1 Tax=Staphylothermus hellenicus (strain DSM 12710 / JCM 10830 / BK20S6-10-b1 / P8) TaxID=591019 RepID=D7DC20_STAHD|nr:hypothetical protein Shell_0592 [Staphylothermus hellenicus DSM 12710]
MGAGIRSIRRCGEQSVPPESPSMKPERGRLAVAFVAFVSFATANQNGTDISGHGEK